MPRPIESEDVPVLDPETQARGGLLRPAAEPALPAVQAARVVAIPRASQADLPEASEGEISPMSS